MEPPSRRRFLSIITINSGVSTGNNIAAKAHDELLLPVLCRPSRNLTHGQKEHICGVEGTAHSGFDNLTIQGCHFGPSPDYPPRGQTLPKHAEIIFAPPGRDEPHHGGSPKATAWEKLPESLVCVRNCAWSTNAAGLWSLNISVATILKVLSAQQTCTRTHHKSRKLTRRHQVQVLCLPFQAS